MKYAYFPGCSLESTAKEFNESTNLVAQAIGIELEEIEDWNCCGATSAHNLDHILSVSLPARNLGLAEAMGLDVVAPAPRVTTAWSSAEVELKANPELRNKINAGLAHKFTGGTTVRSALEVFTTDDALAKVADQVSYKLAGLRPACYYGCLLVRPPKVLGFDDPECPSSLDRAMETAGAEPVEWYFKNECCGASFGLSKSEIVVSSPATSYRMPSDTARTA